VVALTLAPAAVVAAPRIVSLDQCADQYVLALAPRAEITALSPRALNADSAERSLAIGLPLRRASLETALAERASLAVVYWSQDARLPAALAARGVKVVQIDEATDFPGVAADIRKVAAALGDAQAGEALVALMNRTLAASRGAWGGARALYLTPGGFTAGRATLVGAMMAAAGLAPAAMAPGFSAVPLEALALRPPRALVLGFFTDLKGGRQHWTIAGNGFLRSLVRERSVASLPGRLLSCPDWLAADGTLAIARARGPGR